MNSIDPILLQRLIDGELDLPQVQQLVKEADLSPVQWREIATAMIEDRLWQSSFSTGNNDDSLADAMAGFASSEREPVAPVKQPGESIPPRSLAMTDPSKGRPGSQSTSFRYLLAASLLLAVGFGYLFLNMLNSGSSNSNQSIANPNKSGSLDPGTSVASNTPLVGSNSEPRITQTSYRPQYHVEMPSDHLAPDENIGSVESVPLYPIRNSSEFREFQQRQSKPSFSPELIKHLSDSGFRMQEDIEFISGNVNDDESFIIPIRTIRFVPRQ